MRLASRILTILCVAYALLLVYASVMPFDLSAGPETVREHLSRATGSWPFGSRVHTSRADILSNFALYVPLGGLLATRWTTHRLASRWLAGVTAVVVASGVSLGIEAAQLFSLTRIASAQDWLMNTLGGSSGAIAGAACGRRAFVSLTRTVRLRIAHRPAALLTGGLLLVLAADAVFPFLPTLDVSQVAAQLRASHASLSGGLAEHPWHHWLVRRIGVYAVLSGLLGATGPVGKRFRRLRAVLLTVAFVIGIEAIKPFIVSRVANVANVLTGAVGAVLGGLCGYLLAARIDRRRAALLAAILTAAYLGYLECRPFAFRIDASAVARKVPSGAEWFPLYHYAMGARPEDVRLFCRTIILAAALTGAWLMAAPPTHRRRGALGAVLATAGLGLLLESTQFLLPRRVPSTTDVFTFALGSVIGAWVYQRVVTRFRREMPPRRRL